MQFLKLIFLPVTKNIIEYRYYCYDNCNNHMLPVNVPKSFMPFLNLVKV
jgi:hypothetical protein